MAQITLDHILTADSFEDIVDTAGYAIGYWADEAEYDKTGGTYSVSCEEGTEIYHLTREDIESAMGKIFEGKMDISSDIQQYVIQAIMTDDMGEIDGYAADAIIQVACFGSIIYG
jgi:hypothetical protein